MYRTIEFILYLSRLCLLLTDSPTMAKLSYNTLPTTMRTRVTKFQPRVSQKMCELKPSGGPCRAKISMYYFEPKEMRCRKFTWGGCQGNGNRFDTADECYKTCETSPEDKNIRPKWCYLSFDYGFCFGSTRRYYYDKLWKTCKETIYSGCGGNKNNFYSKEQCDSVCRFGTGSIKANKTKTKKDGPKNYLIINPKEGSTMGRGREQKTTTPEGQKKRNNSRDGIPGS